MSDILKPTSSADIGAVGPSRALDERRETQGRLPRDAESAAALHLVGTPNATPTANDGAVDTTTSSAAFMPAIDAERLFKDRLNATSTAQSKASDHLMVNTACPTHESVGTFFPMTQAKNLFRVSDERWLRIDIGTDYEVLKANATRGSTSIDRMIEQLVDRHELRFPVTQQL